MLRDGEPVTHFRTQRARAILAYLALFPKQHSREKICDAIWPDALLEEGRSRLRQELSVLRKTLEAPGQEGELLVADRTTLGLRPGIFTTDCAAFEHAFRARDWSLALRLATGPLLEGFWDEWALQERGRMELLLEEARGRCQQGPLPLLPDTPEPLPQLALPLPLTRFFGRDRECRWLLETVADGGRLISLTGPGGSGKTRLAIEVARGLQKERGVLPLFVSCTERETVSRLAEAILLTVGVLRQPLRDAVEQVAEALVALPSPLLILDGLEQLIPLGASSLVRTLLTQVPQLVCLSTSRQPLDLAGEREFPVMPLAVPDQGLTPERLYLYASVRLFLDRVQAKRPDFSLSARNAEAVGEICRRLEGLPLGLELAAGRCRELSPEAFLERYSERLHEIEARDRDIPARHRSLYALIEESYRELTVSEQRLFARLSVFSGGWSLAAAEAICGDETTDVLDELTTLRDRSLVFVEESGGSQRWRMLELLRTFATEQLVGQERQERLHRHARYFQATAEDALDSSAETENLRAAVQAALGELADPTLALELCVALRNFWLHQGHLREGLAFLDRALSATDGASSLRAEGFRLAGILSRRAGDLEQARQWQQVALQLYVQAGDEAGGAAVHNNLAILARVSGDLEEALRQHQEALARRRRLGDVKGIGQSLNNLAVAYRALGRGSDARTCLVECLSLYEPGSVGIGIIHINLGWVGLLCGEIAVARREFATALEIARKNELSSWYPELWEGIGEVAAQSGLTDTGAQLWGAAAQLRKRLGAPLAPEDQREHDLRQDALRQQLGAEAFHVQQEKGGQLALDEVQALAAHVVQKSGA